MASNIRGDRVVHPDHVAEYDHLANTSIAQQVLVPACVVAGAGTLFGLASGSAVGLSIGLLLGAGAVITGTGMSFTSAKRAQERMAQISWDLTAMREAMPIDEQTISNNGLWIAAQRDYSTVTVGADAEAEERKPEPVTATEALDEVFGNITGLLEDA